MPQLYATYPLDELMRSDSSYQFRFCERVTLNLPISPGFRRASFVNIDFDFLSPLLRLASLILETPCFMGYWYAACLAEPQKVQYANGQGSYRALFRKNEPLDEKDVRWINQFFKALGPHLKFQQGYLPATWGMCEASSQHVSAEDFPVPCVGYGSTIWLDAAKYKDLTEVHGDETSDFNDTLDRILSLAFHLADLVLHELAHAVSIARFGDMKSKRWPFGKRLFSEERYALESTIFGGIVHRFDDSLLMTERPYPDRVESYARRRQEAGLSITETVGALLSKTTATSGALLCVSSVQLSSNGSGTRCYP